MDAVDNHGPYTNTIPALFLSVTLKDPVNNVGYVILTSVPPAGSYQTRHVT